MSSENSQISEPHVLILKLINKVDLRIGEKIITLSNLSIYYTWKNIKSSYNNNKLKVSAQHGMTNLNYLMESILYQIFNIILIYFKKARRKCHQYKYVNKIENRVTFKIKNGYSLERLTPKKMKLLGSTENKITKDKSNENVPHLEINEVVLVHFNIVNNDYQQDSKVLYTFVPNKPFGSLLEIYPTNHILLRTFNSEYDEIEVWFTDQNSQPLEIEESINLTLVIK